MRNIRQLVALNIFSLVFSSLAFAQWNSRNRLEIGMTDNALLSDIDKESDMFVAIATRNKWSLYEQTLGLRLGYKDYSKVNSNDVLSWGLSDKANCLGNKSCEIELQGTEYVYGEPQTTESSFSNYGAALTLEQTRYLRSNLSLDFATGYVAKNYYSLNRLDHTLNQTVSVNYDLNTNTYVEGMADAGLIVSSASEYSAFYFEISGLVEHQITDKWEVSGELGVKQTMFTAREVTTQTQLTRKRGTTVTVTDTSKERYNAVFMVFEANYHFSQNSVLGFAAQTYQQSSKSGLQDYKENQILAKVLVNY